jgi:peptidoglycan hydrolase-like protein with peptidoglycan-binding domain
MDHADKGTTVGGTGGAVAGALVGGPVGAVVGAGVGAYAGNQVARADAAPAARTTASDERSRDAGLVRSVQQALYDRGYAVGSVDGQWGPATEKAVRQFQQAAGLAASGELEPQTLAALGVR